MFNKFLTNNNGKWRLLRTIVQGIIGVIVANIDMLIGSFNFSGDEKAIIVALVMAILSPCMKALGDNPDVSEIDEEGV